MAEQSSAHSDDQDIILRMMYGNADGLRQLLCVYGPRVKGALLKRFGDVLDGNGVDAVLFLASRKAMERINTYDAAEGELGAWFYTIALNVTRDFVRGERLSHHPLEDDYEPVAEPRPETHYDDPPDATSPAIAALMKLVEGLPEQQRKITKADLAAGGLADAGKLAIRLHTTKNNIYVQRHKARESLHRGMEKLGFTFDKQKGTR